MPNGLNNAVEGNDQYCDDEWFQKKMKNWADMFKTIKKVSMDIQSHDWTRCVMQAYKTDALPHYSYYLNLENMMCILLIEQKKNLF